MSDLRARLVRVARRLDARGILGSTDGNLSVRLDHGEVLVTPTGCCKGWLKEDDLVVVRADGSSAGAATTELGMHLAIYAERPDVKAIVHAHPVEATARAVAGLAIDTTILSEALLSIGEVALVGWNLPGTDALASSVGAAARHADVLLLRFHGAVAMGASIEEACFRIETLEHVAQINRVRAALGGEYESIPAGDLALLRERRRRRN